MTKEDVFKLRISRHETQAQFANAVGTTVTTISRWENGHGKPSWIFIREMNRLHETKTDSQQNKA